MQIINDILLDDINDLVDDESSDDEDTEIDIGPEKLSPGTQWLKEIGCERAAWHGGELVRGINRIR